MKRFCTLFLVLIVLSLSAAAQLVTSAPTPLQEGSKGVVLTYNAASPLGNKGLAGLPASTDVYAHIGVITNKSTNSSDWRYVVTPWPGTGNQQEANTDKNRLKYLSANIYSLTIGEIRPFFGITDASEHVKQIAVVFRTGDGTKEGKTASGGNIYIDVQPDGFAIELSSDHPERVISGVTTVNYTLTASQAATLSLSVNGTSVASRSGVSELKASYTFSAPGRYTVTGSAVYEGKTYTSTAEIAWPRPAEAAQYPGGVPKMGAVKQDNGDVIFCLAAPDKKCVQLIGSWNNYEIDDRYDMKYQDYEGDRYFWTTVSGLKDDVYYPYFFLVDEQYRVADPYGHLILDCYSDKYIDESVWPDGPRHPGEPFGDVMMACYRGDLDNYEFSDFSIPDHDKLVIYEMLFRDFTGTDGAANGNGTVRKAIEKIPYIKALGFNAVELMPIMEFDGNNSWGYNPNFYMAPDKAYGSPDDYRDFVEECHRNGIAVILDIVFNQSAGLHPWYQMYDGGNSPLYNKVAPHQWSVLNDWNQGKRLVQQQWTDALKYWMEKYNVDGYRFDLVKGLADNESYAAAGGTDQYNQNRVDHMIRFHDVIKSVKPNGIHIDEFLGGAKEMAAMCADGQIQWMNVNDASCQYTMGWDDGNNNLSPFLSTSSSLPWGGSVSYAESHDEQRMGFKCIQFGTDVVKNDAAARYDRLAALAVQMLLTPGPKMVWQFGEFGDSQNAKTTVSGGENNTSPKVVDWSAWTADADRMFLHDTYKAIINLRMENPELMSQTATFETNGRNSKFTVPRTVRLTSGDKEVVAFINPSTTSDMNVKATTTKLNQTNAQLICASAGFTPQLIGIAQPQVKIPANGFAVFATKEVSGIDTPESLSAPKAYGAVGEIVISGEYMNAEVFDIAGRNMGTLTVPAGLYFVRIDGGAAQKVAVR